MKKIIALVLVLLLAGSGVIVLQRWLRDPVGDPGTVESVDVHSDSETFHYTINSTGSNLPGRNGQGTVDYISYDSDAKTVTYTYTTKHDNEHLSLGVFGRLPGGGYMQNSSQCPTVYVTGSGEDTSLLPADDALVVNDGVAANLVWGPGFYTSGTHSNPWSKISGSWNGNYRCTEVFTVPKAGTTLTWSETTESGYMSTSALVVAEWIKVR